MKEFHHSNYKNYINLLSTLLRKAKEKYFTNFFKENIKNIKKTWKGIKTLVPMKQKNSEKKKLIHNRLIEFLEEEQSLFYRQFDF